MRNLMKPKIFKLHNYFGKAWYHFVPKYISVQAEPVLLFMTLNSFN